MLRVTPRIAIEERELSFSFVRAGGPGGQHVNKVATAVQLRFDAAASPGLPAPVLARLRRLAGRRMTADGVLVLTARRHRSQERNRAEVTERLVELVRLAARAPRAAPFQTVACGGPQAARGQAAPRLAQADAPCGAGK